MGCFSPSLCCFHSNMLEPLGTLAAYIYLYTVPDRCPVGARAGPARATGGCSDVTFSPQQECHSGAQ